MHSDAPSGVELTQFRRVSETRRMISDALYFRAAKSYFILHDTLKQRFFHYIAASTMTPGTHGCRL